MKNYSSFSVENLIVDENFQEWVKHPTTQNKLFWEKWLKQNPHKVKEVEQARLIILCMDFKKTNEKDISKEIMLERIHSSIYEGIDTQIHTRRSFINVYLKVAAVFLGLLISTVSLYLIINQPTESFSTAYGEIKNLTLPDGSKMVLNANSSIKFSKNWGSEEDREVWLKGEAFFNINNKKNGQKFLVKTDHLNVEVLGTQFNVNTRRNNTKVVLNSGKVKLNPKGLINEEIFMDPGELVEVSGDNNKIKKKTVNPEQFSSWKTNQLIFKATPLSDIANILEDNYGWNITFEDEIIKTYQFTGTVSTESKENIKLLLFTISEAFNIEIQEEHNHIIFKH